ncbi:hypothetical protein [Streptomyces marianii]|nr:hypothetical protein [Streptomyces marianii]
MYGSISILIRGSARPQTIIPAGDDAQRYGRELIGLYNVLENYTALSRMG